MSEYLVSKVAGILDLTEAECYVMYYVLCGRSYEYIASVLQVGKPFVIRRVQNIKRKIAEYHAQG